MVERWTISVPEDVAEDVVDQLSYGDNRSEWVVDAIRQKLSGDDDSTGDDEIERAIELGTRTWEDTFEKLKARRAAARAVLQAVKEQPRTRDELLELRNSHPVEGHNERSWWRLNIKSGKSDHPGPIDYVASYSHSSGKWEWHGLDESVDQDE